MVKQGKSLSIIIRTKGAVSKMSEQEKTTKKTMYLMLCISTPFNKT